MADGDLLQAVARIPDHVAYRPFPNETVVLNTNTGQYYGLSETAGAMLTELDRSTDVAAAAEALSRSYSVERARVEADLLELCRTLAARGVLELAPRPEH
jgi:hypothetical protein